MPEITVTEGILAQGEPWYDPEVGQGWSTTPDFLITPGDSEAAIEAVRAAGKRLMMICEHGYEMTREQYLGGEHWGPNYADAYRTEAGIWLSADTQGELSKAQGETMLKVLIEELSARGVKAHIGVPSRHLELGEDLNVDLNVLG